MSKLKPGPVKRPEKAIESMLLEYLRLRGHLAWVNENIPTFDPKQGKYRAFNRKTRILGLSDITGQTKEGKFFAVEVKKPEEYLRIERKLDTWLYNVSKGKTYSKQITTFIQQHAFLEKVRKNKGIGIFASDASHLIEVGL